MIPCAKSELLLFDEVPVQTSITSAGWVDFHSVTTPENGGPLEFYIPGTQDEYLDLNDTKLYLQIKVVGVKKDVVAAPVNLIHCSLFQDVTVTLNDTVVQGGDMLYAYKSMIETLLLFSSEAKESQLEAAGYYDDEAVHCNDAQNSGFKDRVRAFPNDGLREVIGPLHLDLMNQTKYLLPGVDVKIRMTRHSQPFILQCFNNNNPGSIRIMKAILYIRKVKVLPSVVEGHELGLNSYNALYPIQHVSMQTFTVNNGVQSFNKENIFQGRMPKFVVICMVSNQAFNGSVAHNPFYFQSFNVNFCGLYRDGQSIPEREPYVMPEEHMILRPYMGMISALEQYNRNESNSITFSEYQLSKMFFVFNLTPDLVVGSGCQQAYRSGNIRLELKFREALARTINVIVYGVFDGKIEITKNRNIIIDY